MSDPGGYGPKVFEKILNIVDVGIHLIDKEGITVFYNDKMAEIDGFRREQVLGKSIFQLYPSLTHETSTLAKVLATGKEIPEKIQTYVNMTGKRITTINGTYPICDEGKLIGALKSPRILPASSSSTIRSSISGTKFTSPGTRTRSLQARRNIISVISSGRARRSWRRSR
ncbi:PAS domain S-box protein [Paenibacillus sp. P26]|nr:PAS domain S-box protein [Paenibacillus sp. P26]